MSKHLILAAGLLVAGAAAASAADLPVKAPILVDPPVNWSGFYLGGDLGASWGQGKTDQVDTTTTTTTTATTTTTNTRLFRGTTEIIGNSNLQQIPGVFPQTTGPTTATTTATTSAVAATSGKANVNGFMGGVQGGFRQQFSKWVLGVEGDIEGSSERGSFSTCSVAGCPVGSAVGSAEYRLRWVSTLRGTVGYLVTPRVLFYGTGGLAFGGVSVDYLSGINGGGLTAGSFSSTRTGYAVGGGIEGKIDQHWSVRGQYMFVDLGRFSTNLGTGATTTTSASATTVGAPVVTTIFSDVTTQAVTTTQTTTTTSSSTSAQVRSALRDHIFKVGFNYQF